MKETKLGRKRVTLRKAELANVTEKALELAGEETFKDHRRPKEGHFLDVLHRIPHLRLELATFAKYTALAALATLALLVLSSKL